jgi:HEAT repeat protein
VPLLSDAARSAAVGALREFSSGARSVLAREALGALASIGGADVDADVAAAASSGDSERRVAAYLAASRLESSAGIDVIRAAVRDPNRSPLERGAAAIVLGIRRDAPSRGDLAALASDNAQPLEARVGAVIGLGIAGGDGAKTVADFLARDKETRVLKLAAAFALGRSADPAAVRPLTALLRDGDSADLRRTAAASLGSLAIHGIRPVAGTERTETSAALLGAATGDTDLGVRGLALVSLALVGDAAGHRECHRILASGSGDLVAPALFALAIDGNDRDGSFLLEFLGGSAAHRAPAALALGLLRFEDARVPLRQLLDSTTDRSVKPFAALALGFLRDDASVPPITRLVMEAHDLDSCEDAVMALGLIGSRSALVGLRGAADSAPSSDVRALALELLGRTRDTESQRRFEAVLASARSDAEKAAAVRALGFLGRPTGWIPPTHELLANREWDLRGSLLKMLVVCP